MILFWRDLKLSIRSGGGALLGILFFLAIITLAPFAFGPDLNFLGRIGPAMLWIGALLSTLLGLDLLFQADHDDGSLDVMLMQETPFVVTVFIKCLAHWVATVLPLILSVPFLGLLMHMGLWEIGAVSLTLLAGTPAITFIGAAGAALIITLPRGGLLVSILILPFTIPVLIFGVSAAYAAINEPDQFLPPFMILCAISLFFAAIGPWAASASIRASMN